MTISRLQSYQSSSRNNRRLGIVLLLVLSVLVGSLFLWGTINEIVNWHPLVATTTSKTATGRAVGAASMLRDHWENNSVDKGDGENRTFYYLHVPKTGGKTMRQTFRKYGIHVLDIKDDPKHSSCQFQEWIQDYYYSHQRLLNVAANTTNNATTTDATTAAAHHVRSATTQTSSEHLQVITAEGNGFNQGPQCRPKHAMTMFRESTAHVLSQYFHCKESRQFQKNGHAANMPDTPLEWFQAWNDIRQQDPMYERDTSKFRKWDKHHFHCYIPLNYQSWLVGFVETKDELDSMFDAIGIQEEFWKSACLFMTRILGHVPDDCNCSSNNSNDIIYNEKENAKGNIAEAKTTKETLPLVDFWSHGVMHRSGEYAQNLTREEQDAIENLTLFDRRIYKFALDLFQQHVQQVEKEYQVKLCSQAHVVPRGKAAEQEDRQKAVLPDAEHLFRV